MHALPLEIKNNTIFRTLTTGQSEKKACSGYELKDHLGNVRAVVSDVRKPVTTTGSIDDWTWQADITDYFSYYPFGMQEPGRNLNASDYRFGFNGMEKDDEWTGVTGSHYDFGARIYDSRIGRWLSLDPIVMVNVSRYSFTNNNPIIYIDNTGEDNTIYLVLLPNSESKISKEDLVEIQKYINETFRELGLKTKAIIYESSEPFNPQHLDKTDSYALLGTVEDMKSTIKQEEYKSSDLDEDLNSFSGGNTPEQSSLPGKGILVDAKSGVNIAADNFNLSKNEAAGFLIVHGAGHNAGVRHGDENEFFSYMMEGGWIAAFVNQNNPSAIYINSKGQILSPNNPNYTKISDFFNPENNKYVISKMKERFGDNEPKDNYEYNKEFTKLLKLFIKQVKEDRANSRNTEETKQDDDN